VRRLARPLLYVGLIVIVAGLSKAHAAWMAPIPYDLTASSRFAWAVAYCGLLIVATYGTGLPDLPRSLRQTVTSALAAPAIAAIGISFIQLVVGDALLPRFVVFGSAVLAVPWAMFCTALARDGRLRARQRDRVVLVAEPAEAVVLRDELAAEPERPAVLLNHLAPAEAQPTGDGARPLVDLVLDIGASVLVLDRAAMLQPAVVAQAAELHESGVRVRSLSRFYDDWLGKLPLSELERASLLFDIRELHGPRYVRVKRMLDVAVGVVGLLPLALVLPAVLVGNAIGNRGPLLYRQERIGKQGVCFTILKFRTMRDEPGTSTWTERGDARVTPFGRLLRTSHLDELPQVVNILRGDLSLVGPRPEQPRYVADLTEKLPFYDMRHLVRPGLTGWAQVKYGYAGDESDALEKLQYEFWYLRHQSLSLDARVVGRTVRSVVRRGGR
jgi:lipopolysaccharide/colanic/teichoic acid biosynthesis glycosyltransferase